MRFLALLAAAALAPPPHVAPRVELMTSGPHHGDEVPAGTAGFWYALVPDPGGASLHRVRVTVATVKDENNVDEMRLYVSDAGSGAVSEVAVYTTVGC